MGREVKSLEEALEVLKRLRVSWTTINRITNSMWDTGIAFFDSTHGRVAYYDEVNTMLLIN